MFLALSLEGKAYLYADKDRSRPYRQQSTKALKKEFEADLEGLSGLLFMTPKKAQEMCHGKQQYRF